MEIQFYPIKLEFRGKNLTPQENHVLHKIITDYLIRFFDREKIKEVPLVRNIRQAFDDNYLLITFSISLHLIGEDFEELATGDMKELLGAEVGQYV